MNAPVYAEAVRLAAEMWSKGHDSLDIAKALDLRRASPPSRRLLFLRPMGPWWDEAHAMRLVHAGMKQNQGAA